MGCRPCCGCSLQTGTKAIAILQIFGSTMALIGGAVLLFSGGIVTASAPILANATSSSTHDGDDLPPPSEGFYQSVGLTFVVVSIFVLVQGTVGMIMACILYKGASKRIVSKCQLWLIVQCVFLVSSIGFCILRWLSLGGAEYIAPDVTLLVVQSYFLWVVYEFIEELKNEETGQIHRLGQPPRYRLKV